MRTAFNQGLGGLSVGAFATAVFVSFLAFFGIATALGAVTHSHESGVGHEGGPVTERVVVASGRSSEYGQWELVRSSDASGAECLGIQLHDQGPGPVKDDPLYEGCGGPAGFDVGSLSGTNGRSLVYGRAPAEAASVEVRATNREDRTIRPNQAPAESSSLVRSSAATGTTRHFFVASYTGTVHGVEVRALNARGDVIGAQSVPTQ